MDAIKIECFKAYDIRGRVPSQLDEDIAYRIGRACVQYLQARHVVVGYDIRLSSPALSDALMRGIQEGGADAWFIGQCGTEEVYFATWHLKADAGIIVTASHNPMDYNGMKIVRSGAQPVSGDSGLHEIQALAESGTFAHALQRGKRSRHEVRDAYVQHLLSLVDVAAMKPLTVVTNAGNGAAGPVIDALEAALPLRMIKLQHEADGHFPHGVPNPLLEENRQPTAEAVVAAGADLGLAWDGDFDRCFFFDHRGHFVEGYYLVGLLARVFLERHPGAAIIHDPRLIWFTQEVVQQLGGRAVQSKTGHAFIKERMRLEDAVYGGEMSAHHYFRDFAYCDSGMLPWLLVCELISRSGQSLAELVADAQAAFPASGEINREIADPPALLRLVEQHYGAQATETDHTDGLSMSFADWRFNLRMSNTEPVVRLNVESRGDRALMQAKTAELLALCDQSGQQNR